MKEFRYFSHRSSLRSIFHRVFLFPRCSPPPPPSRGSILYILHSTARPGAPACLYFVVLFYISPYIVVFLSSFLLPSLSLFFLSVCFSYVPSLGSGDDGYDCEQRGNTASRLPITRGLTARLRDNMKHAAAQGRTDGGARAVRLRACTLCTSRRCAPDCLFVRFARNVRTTTSGR